MTEKLTDQALLELYQAAEWNKVDALREWVAAYGRGNIDRIASTDQYSRTALLEACARRRAPAALFLIAEGADVNHAGSNGLTPLHAAILGNNADVVTALLDAGADIEKKFGGSTPLQQAAGFGHGAMMQLLINRGADPTCLTVKGEALADIVFDDNEGKLGDMARGAAGRVFGEKAAKACTDGVSAAVRPLKKIMLREPSRK